MADLYYLAFRDIMRDGMEVLSGELYRQASVTSALTDWPPVTLTGADWVSWDQVRAQFDGKRVCFVVHGFNVSVDNAVWSEGPAAQAYENLDGHGLGLAAYDIVVSVLWPGDGFLLVSYFTAFPNADATAQQFAQFLLHTISPAEVSFISHSLGARVVLATVSRAVALQAQTGTALPFKFDTAVLTAAAVDDIALDDPAFVNAVGALRRIVVLSSSKDHILGGVFVFGDTIEGWLWRNYHPDARALGFWGPSFRAGSAARNVTEWYDVIPMNPPNDQDHGDYFPAATDGTNGTPLCLDGWSPKRLRVTTFCCETLDQSAYSANLKAWAHDRTLSFRPGWSPRL